MTLRPLHAFVVFFDIHTEVAVRRAWEALEARGIPNLSTATHRKHRPHMTVAVGHGFESVDWRELVSALPPAPKITFDAAAIFPGQENVAYFSVRPTRELLEFHAVCYQALAAYTVETSPYYRPGYWTPHCTAGQHIREGQLGQAAEILRGYTPISGQIEQMGLTLIGSGEVTLF